MSVCQIGQETVSGCFHAGNGTVGLSEVAIATVNIPITKHIVIRADSGNGDTVSVGNPGQAALGFILNAGEQTPPIYCPNSDDLRVIGGDVDQVFSWVIN
jgi:hypothetical protein